MVTDATSQDFSEPLFTIYRYGLLVSFPSRIDVFSNMLRIKKCWSTQYRADDNDLAQFLANDGNRRGFG